MSKSHQKKAASSPGVSRLVNDPSVVNNTRENHPHYRHFRRNNNAYHVNNNIVNSSRYHNKRGWAKFNPQSVMGNVWSNNSGINTPGFRNQNKEAWAEALEQRNGYQETHTGRHHRSSGIGKRIVEEVVEGNEIIRGSSSFSSASSEQRELETDELFPTVTIQVNKNADNIGKSRSRRKSKPKEGEERHRSQRSSNDRNSKRLAVDDRRKIRFSKLNDRRDSEVETGSPSKINYDTISLNTSSTDEEVEDLRTSLMRQKFARQQARDLRREPGEIIESEGDEEEAAIVRVTKTVTPSEQGNRNKRKRRSSPRSDSVEKSKAAKSSHCDNSFPTNDTAESPISSPVTSRPSTAESSEVNVVDVLDDTLDSTKDNLESDKSVEISNEGQEPLNLIGLGSGHPQGYDVEKIELIDSMKNQLNDKTEEILKQQQQILEMNSQLEGKEQQLVASREVVREREQTIQELTQHLHSKDEKLCSKEQQLRLKEEELKAKEEQHNSKIKAMRGKTAQLENEVTNCKKDLSNAERSLKAAELNVADLQRNQTSGDKPKDDNSQLLVAMAYQDRLFMEVEKLKSVYEVEILRLQDHYQSRMASYTFQPMAMTSAVGHPLVHNLDPAAFVSTANSGNQGHFQSTPRPRGNQQEHVGIFDHLPSPDPVSVPFFGVSPASATRVPLYLNSRRNQRNQTPIPMGPPTVENQQQNCNTPEIHRPNFSMSGNRFSYVRGRGRGRGMW